MNEGRGKRIYSEWLPSKLTVLLVLHGSFCSDNPSSWEDGGVFWFSEFPGWLASALNEDCHAVVVSGGCF